MGTIVAAVAGALVALGLAPAGLPQALACESSKPECHDGHHPPREILALNGTLTTDGGVFIVNAQSDGGQAGGVATLVLGPTGPVREILPPGDGRDDYCVNFEREGTDGLRANFYIRDVGDGVTTFDQIAAFAGDPDLTCSNAAPPAFFFTATSGDIVVTS